LVIVYVELLKLVIIIKSISILYSLKFIMTSTLFSQSAVFSRAPWQRLPTEDVSVPEPNTFLGNSHTTSTFSTRLTPVKKVVSLQTELKSTPVGVGVFLAADSQSTNKSGYRALLWDP
jgi:hypothetical protein